MDVIPVIDLKGGQVVHARRGQRDAYRPIETPLSPTSAPSDVLDGLLRLHPFRHLYVADLDAIEGRGSHAELVADLARARPGLEIWLDNGAADAEAAEAWLRHGAGCLVLGSESQRDAGLLRSNAGDGRVILSLDYRGDAFQGPAEILQGVASWPPRVIAMTLARVGAMDGPDFARLEDIARRAGPRRIFAAGGVRDAADLRALSAAGIAGALVATSLHTGRIGPADLGEISAP